MHSKLASSVVGNLVRAGRLRRKGDEVMFPEEKRVAEEKTTVVM